MGFEISRCKQTIFFVKKKKIEFFIYFLVAFRSFRKRLKILKMLTVCKKKLQLWENWDINMFYNCVKYVYKFKKFKKKNILFNTQYSTHHYSQHRCLNILIKWLWWQNWCQAANCLIKSWKLAHTVKPTPAKLSNKLSMAYKYVDWCVATYIFNFNQHMLTMMFTWSFHSVCCSICMRTVWHIVIWNQRICWLAALKKTKSKSLISACPK